VNRQRTPQASQDSVDFLGFSFVPPIEHLYLFGMFNTTVSDLCDAVSRLDLSVDGEEIAAVVRACETAIAKTMAPLRAFDELLLYRLTKASSSAQYWAGPHHRRPCHETVGGSVHG
jgi:hypothetical protein